MWLKKFVKQNLIGAFLRRRYNRKKETKIESCYASLKACYGKGVHVAQNTYVADDVSIGQYSYINSGSSAERCTIGNYCSISSGVYINPYEHNLKNRSTHPFIDAQYHDERLPVEIGHDVLISLNVVILQGVRIGNGAVIGAGAVVTKDVAPYEIVAGVPAGHIGWRFDEEERVLLEKNQWYFRDVEELKGKKDFFTRKTNVLL